MKDMILLSIVFASNLLVGYGQYEAYYDKEPGCNPVGASDCVVTAADLADSTGCNPGKVMPFLKECIYLTTADCSQDVIQQFTEMVAIVNLTLMNAAALCGTNCTNQQTHEQEISLCQHRHGGWLSLADVIIQVGMRDPKNQLCVDMKDIVVCMNNHSKDCPGLQDKVNADVFDNGNVLTAMSYCKLTAPLPAPTLRPPPQDVIDLQNGDVDFANYDTDPGTDQGTGDNTGDNTSDTTTGSSRAIPTYVIILLAIAGGMLLVALIFGVGYCIERKKKNRLLGDDYGDSQSMGTASAKSYFNQPRYYFASGR